MIHRLIRKKNVENHLKNFFAIISKNYEIQV